MHGTMPMLNRKGRKRKSGNRKPSGDIRVVQVDYRAVAALSPHRRGLPADLRLSEKAESPIGHLALRAMITEHEYQAGQRYHALVQRYLASVNAPRLSQMRPLMQSVVDGDTMPMSTFVNREDRDEALTGHYMRAYEAISESVGRPGHTAINHVVVHGRDCYPNALVVLREALGALAGHFGLTSSANHPSGGK